MKYFQRLLWIAAVVFWGGAAILHAMNLIGAFAGISAPVGAQFAAFAFATYVCGDLTLKFWRKLFATPPAPAEKETP